jgi:hypothetical protein
MIHNVEIIYISDIPVASVNIGGLVLVIGAVSYYARGGRPVMHKGKSKMFRQPF